MGARGRERVGAGGEGLRHNVMPSTKPGVSRYGEKAPLRATVAQVSGLNLTMQSDCPQKPGPH